MPIRYWVLLFSAGPASAVFGQNLPVDTAAMQPYEAHATAVSGSVTRQRDRQPWAVVPGEQVTVRQVITTGSDGYAHFTVAGGGYFDLFSNSRVVFRQNTASVGDLLDILSGRVRVHLMPSLTQPRQRVFTPTAVVSATAAATLALAIDEDDTLRLDVLEGEVKVQHTKLPKADPTVVRSLDAILIRPDEPISRRIDRGSLYRYTVKPFKDIWSAVTPGHGAHNGDVIEGEKFAERSLPSSLTVTW